MPTYSYRCGSEKCGILFDESRSIADRDRPATCKCGASARRAVVESMQAHTDTGYQSEMLSDALGVHPDQIPEAQRRFPHHRFAPDGRMRIGSHGEFKRVLRELGFHDKNAFC